MFREGEQAPESLEPEYPIVRAFEQCLRSASACLAGPITTTYATATHGGAFTARVPLNLLQPLVAARGVTGSGGRPCMMLPRTGREKKVLNNRAPVNGTRRFQGMSESVRAMMQ